MPRRPLLVDNRVHKKSFVFQNGIDDTFLTQKSLDRQYKKFLCQFFVQYVRMKEVGGQYNSQIMELLNIKQTSNILQTATHLTKNMFYNIVFYQLYTLE